jgi:putative ABC transport system permease protein
MDIRSLLRFSIRSLRRNIVRSGLAGLGIAVGVGAVVTMVSIGEGAKARVEQSLAGLDGNLLTVGTLIPRKYWIEGRPPTLPIMDRLTVEDFRALEDVLRPAAVGTIHGTTRAEVSANGRAIKSTIVGTDTAGFALSPNRIKVGVQFSARDVAAAMNVCVITQYLANSLFQDRVDARGKSVYVASVRFVVVGILQRQTANDGAPVAGAEDSTLYVPYTTLIRRIDPHPEIGFSFKPHNPALANVLTMQVEDVLEGRRGKRNATFAVSSQAQIIRVYNDSVRTMTALLASVASVALLVGGIGIMNIVLVSVTERTREIGIRVALGTRQRSIRLQFLVESTLLTSVGGAFGVLVGIAAAFALAEFNEWPLRITLASILVALGFSTCVGLFFGYYPAQQAAGLNPVEALRSG